MGEIGYWHRYTIDTLTIIKHKNHDKEGRRKAAYS